MTREYFKLPAYEHQQVGFDWCAEMDFYALLMEQGTGKTAIVANDAVRRWVRKQIDIVLVLAPNGVHTNWVLRELPKHMPEWAEWSAAVWDKSPNKKKAKAMEEILEPRGQLRFLAANWECLTTERGVAYLKQFVKSRRAGLMLPGDETTKIKNPKAVTTKVLMKQFAREAKVRVIMNGTPVPQSPWDTFAQFNYLKTDFFGTENYTALRAEYAELIPTEHGLMRHLQTRMRPGLMKRFGNNEDLVNEYLKKYVPQIVARDAITGLPKWRNLDKLQALIGKYSYRVLKKDCLDLPEKVYSQIYFTMTPTQRKAYELLAKEFRLQLEDGSLEPVARLASLTKMSQIVSGYFIVPGTKLIQRIMPFEKNPKVATLAEELETCYEQGQQVIIWARFHEEIRDVVRLHKEKGWSCVEYHGDIGSKTARQASIDDFEGGRAQGFISQQQAGGVGLTLIAPTSIASEMTVIYYSNTYSGQDRWQSEDRAHRIGQEKTVRYLDLCAEDSCDQDIAENLRNKLDVAAIVTGDSARAILETLNFDR